MSLIWAAAELSTSYARTTIEHSLQRNLQLYHLKSQPLMCDLRTRKASGSWTTAERFQSLCDHVFDCWDASLLCCSDEVEYEYSPNFSRPSQIEMQCGNEWIHLVIVLSVIPRPRVMPLDDLNSLMRSCLIGKVSTPKMIWHLR